MSNSWISEIWRLTGLLVVGLIIGLLIGEPFLVLFLVTLLYLIWHLSNLQRLEQWLIDGKESNSLDGQGTWGEVFYHQYRLMRRQKRHKRRLASYLNRSKKLIKALPDGAVVLQPNGEIEWLNKAAKQLLGLRPKQDKGQRIENLIRSPAFSQYMQQAQFDEPFVMCSLKDDERMLLLQVVPYSKNEQLLVVRDVTHLHKLELMRKDFVANVSHELCTPLTVINGYLETMDDAGDEALKSWKKPIRLMHQQALRMTQLVEELLLLSKLETRSRDEQLEVVAIAPMLMTLCEEAKALGGRKNQTVDVEIDESIQLRGRGKELRSVFSNLVSNAVHYTQEGGEIKISWYADSDGAHFSVQDNGLGIAPQHIERLTERFYRVDKGRSRESGGTGLGLAIVKHVLECHEAHLVIESQLGEGSLFRCDFPKRRVQAANK